MLLNEILIKKGISTIWAKNGAQAVEFFKRPHKFDAVLLDIKMPVMNGYETIVELRKLDKEVPVIAQTAYAMAEDRRKAIDKGFDDYLAKPIKPELLFSKLNSLLNRHAETQAK